MKTYVIEVRGKIDDIRTRVWTETIRANSESEAISQIIDKVRHTHGNEWDKITDISTKLIKIL